MDPWHVSLELVSDLHYIYYTFIISAVAFPVLHFLF